MAIVSLCEFEKSNNDIVFSRSRRAKKARGWGGQRDEAVRGLHEGRARVVHARARERHAAGRAAGRAPPHRHHRAARLHRRCLAFLRRERQRAAAVRVEARHYG